MPSTNAATATAGPVPPVEVVAVRAAARSTPLVSFADLPVPEHRARFEPVDGPVCVTEPDCTIWVGDRWRAELGDAGAIVLRRT